MFGNSFRMSEANPRRDRMDGRRDKSSGSLEWKKLKSNSKESFRLDDPAAAEDVPPSMTFIELMRVLKPYFWPDAGMQSAYANRFRSTMTWLLVAASRVCTLLYRCLRDNSKKFKKIISE